MGLRQDELDQAQITGKLDLTERHLTELPRELWQLTGIRRLNLEKNRIARLPPEIGQLANLEALDLADNELGSLPPEISKLARLEWLWIARNRLTTLPPEIGMLTNLETLGLSENNLTELPADIGRLANLRLLALPGNRLKKLPREVGQLRSLRNLDASYNLLTALPQEICRLPRLEVLALKDNQITTLPRQLAEILSPKVHIDLAGNPLIEPFPELIERGTEALLAYLRSLDDAIEQYEAKILLVGEGNVGKTSLRAALAGDPFVEGRTTTHGIEIQPLTLPHPDLDVEMTARAWDFGGQEVYRVTHQFFFSRRALYLVVWNAREGQEQNEVEGWVRRIRLRVNRDARVLIVATHCDERHPELDYPQLERFFPGLLAGSHQVDNRTGRGIAQLRHAIAAETAQLPQMGQLISTRWIAARDAIRSLADSEPQIAYERFVAICQRHDVDGSEIITLAELMHDLGQIIYYGDDEGLRDFVVLNPEWLTKAISYVLEDQPTRRSAGILDHRRLPDIWENRKRGPVYASRYHPYFLRLMEKFDVSYRLEDDSHRSLVAQLVPYNRPVLPWDAHTAIPADIRSLALVCQFSEPAPGLVAWLTVRHHRSSTGRHWRNGVFLRHPIEIYASEALIELQTPEQLALEVRAPSPDFFFNVLRDSIEDLITRRWPGLTYQLLIPCPTLNADGNSCPSLIPMMGLIAYRQEGDTHYRCMECRTKHDIAELLTGFTYPDQPLLPELDQIQARLSDIEGGVKRMEGYAADTAASMRRVLRAVGTEIGDCPLLFTIARQTQTGIRRLRLDQVRYELILWCEQPGCWHPWRAANYLLQQPRDWLLRVGPYAVLVLKVLKLATPLAGPVSEMILTDQQLQDAQHQLDLMTAVLTDLPDLQLGDQAQPSTLEATGPLTPAEGQAARALRMLLFELDSQRAFGDLRRVQGPSGDYLWVCPDHYPEYDPGLPILPQ